MIRIPLAFLITITLAGCAMPEPGPRPANETALGANDEAESESTGTSVADRQDEATFDPAPRELTIGRSDWSYAGFDGDLLTTPNYRIHTTSSRNDFVEQLPHFFESALAHYTTALGELPPPQEPLDVFLFQDRRQWQVKTQELLPNQANIFSTLGRGGFATRGVAVLYYIDWRRSRSSRDTFAIAAHEGWHQYTQRTFQHSLPIWLEEGVATYMESFSLDRDGKSQFRPWTNRERRRTLYEAVRTDNLIPLPELLSRSPQSFLETGKNQLLVYYAQVWALTRFLADHEDYRSRLEQVLQDAAHGRLTSTLASRTSFSTMRRRGVNALGRTGPATIIAYFTDDLEAFQDDYLAYVHRLVDRGNR